MPDTDDPEQDDRLTLAGEEAWALFQKGREA